MQVLWFALIFCWAIEFCAWAIGWTLAACVWILTVAYRIIFSPQLWAFIGQVTVAISVITFRVGCFLLWAILAGIVWVFRCFRPSRRSSSSGD